MRRFVFANSYSINQKTTEIISLVDDMKNEIKLSAYENRKTIDKRELADEIKRLDCIVPLYIKVKELYTKDKRYNVIVNIDKQGYLQIKLIFPITQEEYEKSLELKHNFIQKYGKMSALCVRLEEEVYKVSHERVNKLFKDFALIDYQSYSYYQTPLIRMTSVVGLK